jgi:hypothetical protein
MIALGELTMSEPGMREAVEVWLAIDNDGIAVRVYGPERQLTDVYHARECSIEGAQTEITSHYVERGYKAEAGWRAQRWTTDPTGYGEIIHESSRTFR